MPDALTRELEQALNLVDVRVLDHFIVAGTSSPLSFAERGLLLTTRNCLIFFGDLG